MLFIENDTNIEIDTKTVETIANSLTTKDIDLLLCDNKKIKELNSSFRGVDRATDVLSFPLEDNFLNAPLGSLAISLEYANDRAKEFNHSLNDEVALLFIHGVLHLLGYDHEVDSGEMREEETKLIKEFNLPESLIIRNEK